MCDQCTGRNEEFCSTSDDYAGYDGAFKCVANGNGQLTFLRHDTIAQMTTPDNSSNVTGTTYQAEVGILINTFNYFTLAQYTSQI